MSAEFLTPLPGLAARAAQTAIAEALRLDTGSQDNLGRLQGRSLGVVLRGLGFGLRFGVDRSALTVTAEREPEADTIISGSPAALAAMAVQRGPGSDARVHIEGDAALAQDFARLFQGLDPDWERALSDRLGRVIGYQVAAALRGLSAWTQTTASDIEATVGEYLREESGLLVTRPEMREFLDQVDRLRDDVARVEQRIDTLRGSGGR